MRKTGMALSMALCMVAVIAAAGVKQDEGDFVLEGDNYRAKVDGKTGMLLSLEVGGEPAVEAMDISLTEVKEATMSVVQEGADQVVVRVSGVDGDGKPLENAYTLRYVAEPGKHVPLHSRHRWRRLRPWARIQSRSIGPGGPIP